MKYERTQHYIGTSLSLPVVPDDVREALSEVEEAREKYYGVEADLNPIQVYAEGKTLMIEFPALEGMSGRS